MKHKRFPAIFLLLDILLVVLAFLFAAKVKDGTRRILADFQWWRSLFAFTGIWIGVGILGGKYSLQKVGKASKLASQIVKCDLYAITVVFALMYIFNQFHYSRMIVLGTILGSVVLELFVFGGIYYAFRFRRENRDFARAPLMTHSEALEESQTASYFPEPDPKVIPVLNDEPYISPYPAYSPEDSVLVPLWQRLYDHSEVFSFINDYLDLNTFDRNKSLVLNSVDYEFIEEKEPSSYQLFVNQHRINDFRRINRYLIKTNELLMEGGVFICRGQTITERQRRFNEKYTPVFGPPLYFLDFLFRRAMPKIPVLQGWYFALTKGKNRALSETEMLGRFYYCGFELVNKREINGVMHFILKKVKPPSNDQNPTYGPFIRLKRVGQDGKIIYVHKIRTMHPYSEYLQDYVYQTNKLQEGGKFKNDFRVTSWGKILRAMWIDELPQLVNFFQGELSLVGVRALSEHYFSLYPKEVQELRLKMKPGLMPPFYADMPTTFEEIVESEKRYIQAKMEKPFLTDWKYFWKGMWNIIFNHARSY